MAGHAQHQSYSQSQQRQQQPEPRPRGPTTASNAAANDPKSGSTPPKPKLRTSCDGCQEAKLGCSQEKPTCRRCMRHGTTCVYSPFRRIGRPRKSTNPRSSTAAKPRSKNEHADERLFTSAVEYLPDADADGQPGGGITPFDTLIAPPSSPASTDNGCGSWYPWSSDGNSMATMNMDPSANFMEDLDPFSSTTDYLDLDSCFDTHHKMLMNYPLPTAEDTALDIRLLMQPTPPSSVDEEMSVFGEGMTKSPTQKPVDNFLDSSAHQQRTSKAPSASSNNSALKLETDCADSTDPNMFRSNDSHFINSQNINPLSRRAKEELSDNRIFAPKPELTPPLSATSPPPNPCNKRCSTSLIQQLASLSKTLSDNAHPSLDVILQVERDTSSFCRRILTCTTCIDNKSNHLLFSMVVDQITRLFETVSGESTSERCSLLVGTFRVEDSSAKAEILKRLLLSRLTNFGGILDEFSHMIDEDMTDYNTNAAHNMLRDIYQRLDVLKGVIERWD